MSKTNKGGVSTAIQDVLQQRGGLLTILAAVMILAGGAAIVDNPSSGWKTALLCVGIFATVFVMFTNAKVIIKSIFAFFMATLLGTFGFQVGTVFDGGGLGGVVWFASSLFVFFASLSFAYFKPSYISKWTPLIWAEIAAFFVTYVLVISALSVAISAGVGAVVGLGIYFAVLARSNAKSRFKNMPRNTVTNRLVSNLEEAAEVMDAQVVPLGGFNYQSGKAKKNTSGLGTFLMWNNQFATVFIPVSTNTSFQVEDRRFRKKGIKYNNRHIDRWLSRVLHDVTPRVKGLSNVNFIFLDMDNSNGSVPRLIGIPIPDSTKMNVTSFYPARALGTKTKDNRAAKLVIDMFGTHAVDASWFELTQSELSALDEAFSHVKADSDSADKSEVESGAETMVEAKAATPSVTDTERD